MSIERQGNGGKRDYLDKNSDNSYAFKNLQVPGTYYVRVDVPSGQTAKWTACANNVTCHSNGPQDQGSGDTATVVLNSGGYVDLHWNYNSSSSSSSQDTNPYKVITGVASNKCLDVWGNVKENNTPVQIYDCVSGAENQQWKYFTSDGTIRSKASGRCLDVWGDVKDNGTKVEIYDCVPGAPNQRWVFNSNGSICSWSSGRCLDVKDYSTSNNATIQIWDWLNGTNQQWRY